VVNAGLWVANESDGNLLLIDPSDNSVAVIVPTGLNPRRAIQAEGYIWALDYEHDALIQVDEITYRILRVITFPDRDVDTFTAGAGYAWVGYTEREGLLYLLPGEEYTLKGGIARIEPESGEINGAAQTGPVLALVAQPAPAFLWALGHTPVDTPLLRIDPQTMAFQSLALSGSADWPLVEAFTLGGDALWLYSPAFGKLYFAAPDGRLYREISLGQKKPLTPPALLVTPDDLWLAAPWSTLIRFDPGRNRIAAEIKLDTPADQLLFTRGSIWAVSPLGGVVYRIDPQTNTISAVVSTGTPTRPTPQISPTPIQRAYKPCEDTPFSRLVVGERASTPTEPALPNRVHKEPGKETEISGYVLPGQTVVLLEGPECLEGWVWWKIRNEVNKVEGWVAEGDEETYWLIPLK
jgi:hypothetical protein